MQRSVTLVSRSTKRQFHLSIKTKPNYIGQLIRKAFRLTYEIKCLKHPKGFSINLGDIFNYLQENQFEVILIDDDLSDQSESCSQKNMTKLSGRKHPPSEHQLLDSKYYLDDFQLFISEVSRREDAQFYGILFFSSKKKALFLAKKILRELIFQISQISFFYAIHPIKVHSKSALLGQLCVFSLFHGPKMIHERQFPEQITTVEQILNYIKGLISLGQLSFDVNTKHKNLISVYQQGSFDGKIEQDSNQLKNNQLQPAQMVKTHSVSPIKESQHSQINYNHKESLLKSQITNEISFENEFYQPNWFFEGNLLTRVQKSFLSAFIQSKNIGLSKFCQALDLKSESQEKLNINLFKIFIKEIINQELRQLSNQTKLYIELNQQNRQCFLFSALLGLFKFGRIKDFIETVKANLQEPKKQKIIYSNLAFEIDQRKAMFAIQLFKCDKNYEKSSPSQNVYFVAKGNQIHHSILQIANNFYQTQLKQTHAIHIDNIELFTDKQLIQINKLIKNNDAFLKECFQSSSVKHKLPLLPIQCLNKYIAKLQEKDQIFKKIGNQDPNFTYKLQKLRIFMGLIYFCYKQRLISKKHLKCFFYLFTWSDLKLLSAFEFYLMETNIDEFLQTLYSIDYIYFLQNKYTMEISDLEELTPEMEEQLIVLFLVGQFIPNLNQRLALERFILSRDRSILQLLHDEGLNKTDFIKQIIELGKQKKQKFDILSKIEDSDEVKMQKKKKQRCKFIEQILPVHFKHFKKVELAYDCVMALEPNITAIFDLFEMNNEITSWIDSFKVYIQNIDSVHQQITFKQITNQSNLKDEQLQKIPTDLFRAIYEVYLQTKDKADTIDTLERAIKKYP